MRIISADAMEIIRRLLHMIMVKMEALKTVVMPWRWIDEMQRLGEKNNDQMDMNYIP